MSYESPIRKGVLSTDCTRVSDEFDDWSRCLVHGYQMDFRKLEMNGNAVSVPPTSIIFDCVEDQAAYLLTWTEDHVVGYDSLILPIIRRTMPSIIANDIIGVSPMTGPTGQIFALRSRHLPSTPEESTDGE